MQIGEKVPQFSLLDQNGTKRTNNGLKTPLVLFFYPKDDTPGCTKEACNLRDNYNELKNTGFEVVGVSADKADKHIKFIEKYITLNSPNRCFFIASKVVFNIFSFNLLRSIETSGFFRKTKPRNNI